MWVCWVSSVVISSELRQSFLGGEETLIRQETKEPLKVQERSDTKRMSAGPSQG